MDDPLFSDLDFWPCGAADGPTQMATDEILLRTATRPLLRVWEWSEPTVSFGCLMPLDEVQAGNPGHWPMVRRWTGGGLVHHRPGDTTYSLIVPTAQLGRLGTVDASYGSIHRAVATALRRAGIDAELAAHGRAQLGGACFEKPVGHDLLLNGRKIAGAGQRRTKSGLLHQGAIQGLPPLPDLPLWLAEALGSRLHAFAGLSEARRTEIAALVTEKYATDGWLDGRRRHATDAVARGIGLPTNVLSPGHPGRGRNSRQ